MKPAVKADRSYGLAYKKKTISTDPYLPRGSRGKVLVCEGCRAVHMNKRWYADDGLAESIGTTKETVPAVCPACQKMRDNFPGGIVTLRGGYVLPHKQDILNLVKNEEGRARGMNPLERIMAITEDGRGNVVITTTNEKMAQRIGRAIRKAFHGDVSYDFSHDNKLARVEWVRE
jgi:NMD protein affecting ribosome stability and mRNA decay